MIQVFWNYTALNFTIEMFGEIQSPPVTPSSASPNLASFHHVVAALDFHNNLH